MITSRRCSECGAQLPPGADGPVVTCQYCGASFEVGTGDRTIDGGRTRATRSTDTRAPVTITFVNATGRTLELVWLDFEGREVGYGDAAPDGERIFDTYVDHVWSVRADGTEMLRWAAFDQVPRRVRVA